MYKLTGLDAGFLYNETPRAPQHIASVQVLELPEGTNLPDFIAGLKRLLVSRAHRVPYFTNKLQRVPFELDHPAWVRDEAFDIDEHVLHTEVEQPGGRRQLEAKIAELHALPMDRSRPLWQLWVLSGLEHGRIAYYNRVHHVCLDGVSGQAATEAIMDLAPEAAAVEPPPAAFQQRPARHGLAEMLINAGENLTRYQLRQAARVLDQVETAWRLWQRSVDPGKGFGAALEGAPTTRFNRSVQRPRRFATAELPLDDVRRIGKATGTTVNDVFLAVCSGGLQRYLGRCGELPARSLIAGCPVSLRKPGDASASNQVTMMLVSLASNEPDAVERLLKIGRSSRQGKGLVADMAGSYDTDVALPGLPALQSASSQWLEAAGIVDLVPPQVPCNVAVSNVPGPRQQLYSFGAKMLTHYPVSMPVHSQAVNITVQSYIDQLYVGITACARALPDPDVLRDDMLAAYTELKQRVLKEPVAFTPRERAMPKRLLPLAERPAEPLAVSRAG